MLPILLASMLAAAPDSDMTAGELDRATPVQLAARLLPPAAAARIVDGRIRRGSTPWRSYEVRLWERSIPIGPMLCRREFYSMGFSDPVWPAPPDPGVRLRMRELAGALAFGTTYPQRASLETCARVVGYVGVLPNQSEAAVEAMTRLTEAMRAAARRDPLPFELRCRMDGSESCGDARAALATLPLEALEGVEFSRSYYAAATDPPPPPGETVMPTVRFGMSGSDGRSWFVTLIGDRGGLREVRMRRSMVIYD